MSMLDNLSGQDPSPIYKEEGDDDLNKNAILDSNNTRQKKKNKNFLGLKPQQLFILLLMLLVVVCLLGTMFLLVTGKIVPPFL